MEHDTHQIDPALFDGIEVCCPFKPKLSNKEGVGVMSKYHQKVYFDLINEALVSFTRDAMCVALKLCHIAAMFV